MAHHLSAIKRIRQNSKRRLQNRYYKKSTRTAIKNFRDLTDKEKAAEFLPKIVGMIDRLAKRGNIHVNKSSKPQKRFDEARESHGIIRNLQNKFGFFNF